ncbi:hypothetical protein Chor_013090 [Crotalus horridus]
MSEGVNPRRGWLECDLRGLGMAQYTNTGLGTKVLQKVRHLLVSPGVIRERPPLAKDERCHAGAGTMHCFLPKPGRDRSAAGNQPSNSAFAREPPAVCKIVGKLSEWDKNLVSEELTRLMDGLIEDEKSWQEAQGSLIVSRGQTVVRSNVVWNHLKNLIHFLFLSASVFRSSSDRGVPIWGPLDPHFHPEPRWSGEAGLDPWLINVLQERDLELSSGGRPTKAILEVMEDPTSCPYYSFQVFSLWLQRVRECLDNLWKVKESVLLGDNSALLQKLNKIVWNNAESPNNFRVFISFIYSSPILVQAEGVSDFVHSAFRILLEIYSLEGDRFGDPERPLFREYLQRVIFMPWEARAKYFALTAVLPYLGPQQVLDIYTDLPQDLFNCLSTNRLCPVASDLYKTFLQRQRKAWTELQDEVSEEQLAHKWSSCWLPILSRALTSSDSFLQSNASSHLLGWTLRVFPASYALLASRFAGREASQLRAWVSLLNIQKTIAGDLLTNEETLQRLTCCLFSKEEHVRLAALGFLCLAPRTSQGLSQREIQLLKEFLPLNLSCNSSSFRQLLQAMVKKALVRMRDSSLAGLRPPKVNQKESSVRKEQERGILQAVGNMATLLCWSRSKGYWDFFSTGNTLALLSCLQDSTNEIRELASELLISYFPPALPGSTAVALFGWALEAVSSPRVQESEAGAVVMKSLLPKLDSHILRPSSLETEKERSVPCKYLSFLEHLLNLLQKHFVTASCDLLLAAHTTPIHGVILGLRRCLLEIPDVVSSMLEGQKAPHWRLFFQRLVMTMRDISNLLLSVLQSNQAPSTDQHNMGNAISSFIQLGKGLEEEREEDLILLSEDHSLILTCCWVSVKEIGLLLGGLAEKVLPQPLSAGCEPLLPLQIVNVASKVFQDILLKCRHWGAVEGCSVGFTKFCTTLLSIVTGEDPAKSRPLLTHGMQTLLTLANQSISHSSDQTVDLPQVSAIHVLQTLVRGSNLGPALQQHITPLMMVVFKALSSPSWAMRNAANQLLGALTVRLLGQKWSPDDGRAKDGVSPEALFGRHVHLRSILLGELTLAVERSISEGPRRGKFHLCPSLYAVLTFLAKLQPSRDTQDRLHPELLRSVACMMESHIWMLMDTQQCPLIRAIYLQVLCLLRGSCAPSFVQQVWELLYRNLASPKPGFFPVQPGSSIFCQWAINFLCYEATRQESPERIGDLSWLLQKGNPDVQAAVLTWLWDNKERKGLKSNKELQLIFVEKFKEVLRNTGEPTALKLYLQVLVDLFGNLAQRQPFPEKLASECGEILFFMVESDHEGPGLRDHALCAATLFLSQYPESDPLWERWIATIEQWSDSLSDEVLRMAAAKAIKMGGPARIWRVRKSPNLLLHSQVLRLVEAAIHLLQDEEQKVRHEAASFISRLVQTPPPIQQVQPHNSCFQLQSSKALFSLLQFLLENFGDHPSTFASLVHHLPVVELNETLMELESQGYCLHLDHKYEFSLGATSKCLCTKILLDQLSPAAAAPNWVCLDFVHPLIPTTKHRLYLANLQQAGDNFGKQEKAYMENVYPALERPVYTRSLGCPRGSEGSEWIPPEQWDAKKDMDHVYLLWVEITLYGVFRKSRDIVFPNLTP